MAAFLRLLQNSAVSNYSNSIRHTSKLSNAVREAERVVGYSTSFLNLRWLLTDEIANVALHIRKLVGVNHPLLQTARKIFMDGNVPNWGVVVLLISKAAGFNNPNKETDKDRVAGVLNSQRVIAEVTEMIRMSHLIHTNVISISENIDAANLNFGNRLALLSGDYLLAKSYHELAHVNNHDVSFLMSLTLRDLVESEFISCKPYKPAGGDYVNIQTILQGDPLNNNVYLGNPRAEWVYRSILGGASLLANACKCALKLGKHPECVQLLGYNVGMNVALAWQTQLELQSFVSTKPEDAINLVSAPVMLQLEQDNSLYDLLNVPEVDYYNIKKHVLLGDGLNATKLLQKEFCSNALKTLTELPSSDARSALENVINTIK